MNANARETCEAYGIDDACCLLVINTLAARAHRRHLPAPRSELSGLAGLAVTRAAAYYDPDRATCSLREWLFSQGWRLLLSAVRDARRRTQRSVPAVTFTDLAGRDESACPCPSAAARELRDPADMLADVLDGLAGPDREILVMRLERRTLGDIARRRGLSIEAIRQRLLRLGRQIEAEGTCNE
ncbi:MAG: sigma-70 family RNA polymerase sigma factor [Phycisphaerae bacterium]|nr:sigma-70 family RNA polymerase sigma factor [Phycisphaerae bacterium]